MSDISIRREHALTQKQARAAADNMAKRLTEEFGMQFEWDGDVLGFTRSGVDGTLTLLAKAVEIEVNLGFLLAMMKPKIERSIEENLDATFSAAKTAPAKPTPAKKPAAKKK